MQFQLLCARRKKIKIQSIGIRTNGTRQEQLRNKKKWLYICFALNLLIDVERTLQLYTQLYTSKTLSIKPIGKRTILNGKKKIMFETVQEIMKIYRMLNIIFGVCSMELLKAFLNNSYRHLWNRLWWQGAGGGQHEQQPYICKTSEKKQWQRKTRIKWTRKIMQGEKKKQKQAVTKIHRTLMLRTTKCSVQAHAHTQKHQHVQSK